MNKSRRKELSKIIQTLQKLKDMENNSHTLEILQQAADDLECISDEEQDAYDALPDNLMWSSKADTMTDNLDNLADAMVDMAAIVEAYELVSDRDPYQDIKAEVDSVIQNCTEAIERV